MVKLSLKEGLLYASVKLFHQGNSIEVKDMIVDTGASHTIIIPDYLEEMDTELSDEDTIVKASGYGGKVCYSVRKRIDKVECGDILVENMKIDFGEIDPKERVNGLLGLDFLKNTGIIIDLVELEMYRK
ncbi:MAG: retropepsin-like domain-containing protein [Anaeromicrobium sp.]|jgi:predicted aspartyl protease|uniref:retropepsin-like aspartic protease n=1 Tax=Anaeromicrobium sp. TaxID=1929132 RepID=UPI0025F521BD|nr:retropepsin-like aspartic protease [Anaeromicrobium sp.]MCT4595653.1 retropepsin-like domain-containing protein [Anaeromicrobium sp.]